MKCTVCGKICKGNRGVSAHTRMKHPEIWSAEKQEKEMEKQRELDQHTSFKNGFTKMKYDVIPTQQFEKTSIEYLTFNKFQFNSDKSGPRDIPNNSSPGDILLLLLQNVW